MARCGERNGYASCARAPFDDGSGFAFGKGVTEREVVVVCVFEIVEIGQVIVFRHRAPSSHIVW